jgi:C4-dicarboxylate-binding protein DctP
MKKSLLLLVGVLWSVIAGVQTSADMLPKMRISVENTPTHVQTKAVRGFAEDIRQQLAGRIDVTFFPNAQLFRDRDVVQALIQGKVEMAVPGTWQIDRFEPNVGIFLLPIFYGRPAQANYRILEGEIGNAINARIEQNLQLKVLGRWLDLGHAHLFGVQKQITSYEDIHDLNVRVAGGIANELRIQALGGNPMSIPWSDLPAYLQQGKVDAILTSYETIKSAKLWEYGVNTVFEDREYFPQYIPLVRLSFWSRLPADVQQILLETWEKYVDPERQAAAAAQAQAKEILRGQGIEIVVPDAQVVKQRRAAMLRRQDEFVTRMKIDPDLSRQLLEIFREEGL